MPKRRFSSAVISKPLAKMMQSTSYSIPWATIPVPVIRSTPLDADTSTSVTLGRLKAGRYSSLKHGRLHRNR
jgi:hypothetical protein